MDTRVLYVANATLRKPHSSIIAGKEITYVLIGLDLLRHNQQQTNAAYGDPSAELFDAWRRRASLPTIAPVHLHRKLIPATRTLPTIL